jgi:hypothetical protein
MLQADRSAKYATEPMIGRARRHLQFCNHKSSAERIGTVERRLIARDEVSHPILSDADHVDRHDHILQPEINDLGVWKYQ